jgi:phosphoribosylaminoimidazole-succinocarboxamide synthase
MKKVLGYVEEIPFPLFKRGKVRDLFELDDCLLMIATDRISAFDVVLPTLIPYKGDVLNQISLFWFSKTERLAPNHLSEKRIEDFLEDKELQELLKGRSVIVKKAEPLPFEAIVRGYLAGSAWKEYRESGGVGGILLPAGMKESEQFPEPIFTSSTKGDIGEHDINIGFEEVVKMVGVEMAERVRQISLQVYREAASYARTRGIIIADTKFEFGIIAGRLAIIDELLTPDSSRFWPLEGYAPGRSQPSYDKQFVRDYILETGWTDGEPPPELPPRIVERTSSLYREIFHRLTGRELGDSIVP